MNNLISIIIPVIRDMEESHLKQQLLTHLPKHEPLFSVIESSFRELTSHKQDTELLRHFFHSWSQTNNSAMTVAGLSNRLSMLIHKNQPVADESQLLRSIVSLNRIVDEDLAVVGKVLHSKLFYTMATTISGDDQWLLHAYNHPDAKAFKDWKDQNSLHEKDIMLGLLTTLVHEIYTHGEVEYILPMFKNWLETTTDLSEKERLHTLAWISVHCGPTEKNHFFFAVNAIHHFAKAMDVNIEDYSLEEIISTYLTKKTSVMQSVMQIESVHSS
jgi:hypothetical protein